MKASVVIPTYNRAADLRETLKSLSALRPSVSWEVIVVDNNSSDETPSVVNDAATTFPVSLRYLHEPEQGRCAALNAGIRAAQGDVIVTTDDDVRFEPDWVDQAVGALGRLECDYIGGRVLPIWDGPQPEWLSRQQGGPHWAVMALLNYGPDPQPFGPTRVPLGVNMAFRKTAFARAGLWDNRLGRKAGTLIGQEVREWGLRARAAGLRGYYVPEMIVHHIIPADRLRKPYFRRWFYWHGVSRAMLYKHIRIDMEAPEHSTLDFSKVPHIAGVPRYMYRSLLMTVLDVLRARLRGDVVKAFERELWLYFYAGVFRQRWTDRHDKETGNLFPSSSANNTPDLLKP